ncbi:MAG: hypothetical protein K0U84_20090 [Actinomycetia bacterium]|nr:hypothetical protein [Actinomycetes bacterium]
MQAEGQPPASDAGDSAISPGSENSGRGPVDLPMSDLHPVTSKLPQALSSNDYRDHLEHLLSAPADLVVPRWTPRSSTAITLCAQTDVGAPLVDVIIDQFQFRVRARLDDITHSRECGSSICSALWHRALEQNSRVQHKLSQYFVLWQRPDKADAVMVNSFDIAIAEDAGWRGTVMAVTSWNVADWHAGQAAL